MTGDEAPLGGLLAAEEEQLLSRLTLNARAAAQVCGISVRQLTYWSDRGLIPTLGARRYGIAALNKALMIKQALDQGFTLQRAARMVEEQLAAVEAERASRAALPLSDLHHLVGERLSDLLVQVRRYRQMLLTAPPPADDPSLATRNGVEGKESPRSAKDFALRLNRAVDELAAALSELGTVRELV